MILVIDNYDSFTYNLVQYIGEFSQDIKVVRNDEITVEEIKNMDVEHIVLSPGPGYPKDAGICIEVVQKLKGKIPILGVCLGHQAIGEAFGGKVTHAKHKLHGKITPIDHENKGIFKGIEQEFQVTRYHSLIIEESSLPKELEVTAYSKEKEIMGIQNESLYVYGVQFHPESIFTQDGKKLIHNFLSIKIGKKDNMQKAIQKLIQKENLTLSEMKEAMNMIMEGKARDSQIGSFLTALRMKKETSTEITAAAKVMREKSDFIDLGELYTLDTCGTGGDGGKTFNISTTVAFVAAAAGIPVVKHGNRSVSSKSGSADVLEALGINISLNSEEVKKEIEEIGIGFMFAPIFHKAMKYALGPRKELEIRTIFNILGPLTNPAFAKSQVLGVYSENLTEVMAEALNNLGTKRAMVVHGEDGLDEITTTGKTKITELKEGKIKTYYIHPEDFGLPKSKMEEISGDGAKENAQIILEIFQGKKGPKRDIVVLNSAAALMVGGKANSFKEGINLAEELIDSKKALEKLQQLVAYTNAKEVKK